ncbi:MAG: DUF4124 domain-containing protein [Pseudomonadota bacterium]
MKTRPQRGYSLVWVAIISAGVAGLAMAALFSMRYERNLFAEAAAKLVASTPAQGVIDSARSVAGAPAPPGTVLRKCVVGGKTVISNVECTDKNPTSRALDVRDSVSEAPKKPAPADSAPTSNPQVDKILEKQLH